jgi:hypothetical protein
VAHVRQLRESREEREALLVDVVLGLRLPVNWRQNTQSPSVGTVYSGRTSAEGAGPRDAPDAGRALA